jgi:hypothetical protein
VTAALTLEAFLSKENTNTKNVLYNIAVVNARLSNAIAKALNLQKNIVESISEEINRISALNVEINRFKPNSTKGESKKFGNTTQEAAQLLQAMKKFGVNGSTARNIDEDIRKSLAGQEISYNDNEIQLFAQELSAASEKLSSKSQQETLRIQTFTSRYTQATDQATNVVQKDGQSKSTIIQNFRS